MGYASSKDGTLDGRRVPVSRDMSRAVAVPRIAATPIDGLQRWDAVHGVQQSAQAALDAGTAAGRFAFDPQACGAPLPRCPQRLDGSALLNQGRRMERAFDAPPIPHFDTIPVMYPGAGDDCLGPHDDVPLPTEADGNEKIDLGEIRAGFMRCGDRVRTRSRFEDGSAGPFGTIDQRVVRIDEAGR